MIKKILKLGTRRSLLAWAQSGWVAREIERLNPGFQVELFGIETRGDQIQDIPLQKVEGKDFFVAELDQALDQGRVDLTVHSLKDLSLERPNTFVCAAVPRRANPRDVVLFGPRTLQKLRQGEKIKIGTSSPRRLENIPAFLEKALPRFSTASPVMEWVEIRGNVNTRLSRVHEPDASPRQLDGVVLAFAGLIRLWADSAGRAELEKLLAGVRWMVLPLDENPAAPGQGALAVECRANDSEVSEAIQKLHHRPTQEQIGVERKLLAESGGGCHQRFGATCLHSVTGELTWVKGEIPSRGQVQEILWKGPQASVGEVRSWDGSFWRGEFEEDATKTDPVDESSLGLAVFVGHSRAVHGRWVSALQDVRVWTSGTSSWFKLAQQGIWVEGCAEGLGFESLSSTLKEDVLGLPEFLKWTVLTHSEALSEWLQLKMNPLGTYQVRVKYPESVRAQLRHATDVFWSSGSQINELKGDLPKNARHACGPGKTAEHLRKIGIEPLVFPKAEEWRKWIKSSTLR
jgi:hydroxymethylbilane synthase